MRQRHAVNNTLTDTTGKMVTEGVSNGYPVDYRRGSPGRAANVIMQDASLCALA